VEYIVVEEQVDSRRAGIHQKLREYLKLEMFQMVKKIPLKSTYRGHQSLIIYRNLNAKPLTSEYLTIRLPVVGHTITAPLPRLRGVSRSGKLGGVVHSE
jgi:hypothetical protein